MIFVFKNVVVISSSAVISLAAAMKRARLRALFLPAKVQLKFVNTKIGVIFFVRGHVIFTLFWPLIIAESQM